MPRKKERKNARKTRFPPLFEINAQRNTLRQKNTQRTQKKRTWRPRSPTSLPPRRPRLGRSQTPRFLLPYICVCVFCLFFLSIFFEIFALFAPFFSYSRCFFYHRRRLFVVRLGLLAEATFARKKMTPLARAFSPLVRVVVLKEGLPQKRPSPREEEKSPNKRE